MKRINKLAMARNKSRLVSALCAVMLSLITASANASLILTINTYTTDELSFSISGAFDADTIGTFPGYLAVKNDWSNNIGTHTELFSATPIIASNTIQIGGLTPQAYVQNDASRPWNDSIFFRFLDNTVPFAAGTTVSGSITLTGVGLFNPGDRSTLQLVSGLNFGGQIGADDDWARLEARVVPIPTTLALFGLGLAGLGYSLRNRPQHI